MLPVEKQIGKNKEFFKLFCAADDHAWRQIRVTKGTSSMRVENNFTEKTSDRTRGTRERGKTDILTFILVEVR